MMNTLPLRDILERLRGYEPLRTLLSGLGAGPYPLDIGGVEGSFASLVVASVENSLSSLKEPKNLIVVLPTDQEAEAMAGDLELLGLEPQLLPWWKTAAYRPASSSARTFGERSAVLAKLVLGECRLLVASERAFVTPFPSVEEFAPLVFPIAVGESIDPVALGERLVSYGYLRVPRVSLPGEFALRGEVLDLFMPGEEAAVRIVFEYDKIERLGYFDAAGQGGLKALTRAVIRPMKELIWTEDRISALRTAAASVPGRAERARAEEGIFPGSTAEAASLSIAERAGGIEEGSRGAGSSSEGAAAPAPAASAPAAGGAAADGSVGPGGPAFEAFLEELSTRGESRGEELWYPLAYKKKASVLDYLKDGLLILFDHERLEAQEESSKKEYEGLYRVSLRETLVPPPDRMLFSFSDMEASYPRVLRSFDLSDSAGAGRIKMGSEPGRSFFGNIQYFKEELSSLLKAGYQVHIYAETDAQADRIQTLLKDYPVQVMAAGISAGFQIPALKLLVVQENEIFGRRRRAPKSVKTARSAGIDSFVELNPGDYVVHVNYGIGRFVSIERMKVLGNERDYIKIEYAEEETVFVPIEQANLVQRYIGNEGEEPKLDALGSKSWEHRKSKVKKAVEELAERLIRIYARRKTAKGFAYPPDNEWQLAFEAAFPYEETPDQLRCIDEVKADMESPKPMDRLICGDVGYGKTEIAMRACFKAATAGKQVAFLAPTTILAEQHFDNFKERFENFPIRIAMLSRLVEKKEQRKILEGLREGQIDLVIGTHRLLQKDVEFKNLGLLVVDEEQRFGVKAKERLKEMRASIDALTLTATPIPRTLHMSLLKIRDMSVLNTPPFNRQPIETIVEEFNPQIVADAIRKEIARGGQVFYLHNRIESLDEIQAFLSKLVPEVIIETAHGQMDAEEIEDIMHRFIHGGFQVLVSTTIIENGIDIPNVNTIIIDRADMYGISQLYQLRGRVGRSDRQAYAYLFYPDRKALSELAMKRLQVISDFTELGSGFKIAMKDLEVRGAGNLLGREQSGDIYAVGFDLYLKLLDEAVKKLSEEGYEAEEEPYLELDYAGYLPDEYISLPTVKMEVYKKIASIYTDEDLDALRAELSDRFGPLPDEAESLLALAEIRIICRKLSIASLKERGGIVVVEFSQVAKVSVEKVLRLMRESGGRIKLDPHRPNVLIIKTGSIGLREKSEFLREKLAFLLK